MSMTIRLDPADNVVTATRTLEAGTAVDDVVTTAIIPRNHRTLTVTSTSFEWFFWCKTSQMGANYCTLTLASYRLTHTMLNSATPRKITRFPPICARPSLSPRRRAIALWDIAARMAASAPAII